MQYRLIAIALILAGFLAINYFTNEQGQQEITEWTGAQQAPGQAVSATEAQLSEDLKALRAFEDTLSTLDVRAETSLALKDLYRSQIEKTQQFRTSEFLRQSLWRQTLYNLLWGLFSAIFLLPLAMVLDQRVERALSAESPRGKEHPRPTLPPESTSA